MAPPAVDVDIGIQVKNAGPGDAERISILVGGIGSLGSFIPVNCSADGLVICYQETSGWWVVIPHLAAGSQISIDLGYRNGLSSIATAIVPILALPLSSDPNMADNATSLTVSNAPLSTLRELNVGLGAITYFRSDYAERCDASCSNYTGAVTYGEKTSSPSVSVWVPSPQQWYGNWWTFSSWADGVTDNPRVFDTTRDVPISVGGTVFTTSQALGAEPASLDLVALPGAPPDAAIMNLFPPQFIPVPAIQLSGPACQCQWTVSAPDLPWLSLRIANVNPNGIAVMTAAADNTGIGPGTYSGSFLASFSIPGQAAVSMSVPVTLRIMEALPTLGAIVDAGGYRTSAISPGQIITIFGSGIGPDRAAAPLAGQFHYSLGGTSLVVDGEQVPILYAQSNQVSAIMPSDLDRPAGPIDISLQLGGVTALSTTVNFANPTPALFTADGSGRGGLAAVNQDGTLNSPANPAKRGSLVSLYGSGMTPLNAFPESCDSDSYASGVLARSVQPVEVTIGNELADVLFAGVPPGMPCAVQQINIVIPQDSVVGPAVPTTLRMADNVPVFAWTSAQDGLTLAIQ